MTASRERMSADRLDMMREAALTETEQLFGVLRDAAAFVRVAESGGLAHPQAHRSAIVVALLYPEGRIPSIPEGAPAAVRSLAFAQQSLLTNAAALARVIDVADVCLILQPAGATAATDELLAILSGEQMPVFAVHVPDTGILAGEVIFAANRRTRRTTSRPVAVRPLLVESLLQRAGATRESRALAVLRAARSGLRASAAVQSDVAKQAAQVGLTLYLSERLRMAKRNSPFPDEVEKARTEFVAAISASLSEISGRLRRRAEQESEAKSVMTGAVAEQLDALKVPRDCLMTEIEGRNVLGFRSVLGLLHKLNSSALGATCKILTSSLQTSLAKRSDTVARLVNAIVDDAAAMSTLLTGAPWPQQKLSKWSLERPEIRLRTFEPRCIRILAEASFRIDRPNLLEVFARSAGLVVPSVALIGVVVTALTIQDRGEIALHVLGSFIILVVLLAIVYRSRRPAREREERERLFAELRENLRRDLRSAGADAFSSGCNLLAASVDSLRDSITKEFSEEYVSHQALPFLAPTYADEPREFDRLGGRRQTLQSRDSQLRRSQMSVRRAARDLRNALEARLLAEEAD
jgi:hypothetical protein